MNRPTLGHLCLAWCLLAALRGAGPGCPAFFCPAAADDQPRHLVPADKHRLAGEPDLRARRTLCQDDGPRVYRGKELNLIGMPIGGLAAGQLYLCGDGTLGEWKLFNQQYFSGYGRDNFRPRMPERPIEQGFAVIIREGDRLSARRLDRLDFPAVEFVGEYPLARVRYRAEDFPLRIELEAFSPFIPLNAKDSALPATILRFTLENTSDRPLAAGLLSWLENPICLHNTRDYKLLIQRRSRVVNERGRTLLQHTAAALPPVGPPGREPILLADFEESYQDWTIAGEAFGDRPAPGTLAGQSPVTGFLGRGLVNTFRGGDAAQGRLTSPKFPITRKFLNFLIGGGKHPGQTCVNLLIDGQVVRSATGENSERLLWHSWDVGEFENQLARIEIVDEHTGGWGHISVDQIELADQQRFGMAGPVEELEDFGTMVLALAEPAAEPQQTRALLAALDTFGEQFCAEPDSAYPSTERRIATIATRLVDLPAHQKRGFVFVLAWYFPNRPQGNMYANWFTSAADVAHYVLDDFGRLSAQTHLWHDTYYDSTLPRWLLDRLHSTVSNLATGMLLWWADGRVWAWEGVGCCAGTCTHVWNYAHALARLFPELERRIREMQDLDVALHDDGLVGFRGQRNRRYAADGQCGTVLKCYREHQMSPDDSFLRNNWPRVRKVLEYAIGQDGNDDGLIENSQHNTYDIEFYGANTFVGSLYLAALRAGEEMAREVGDFEFAHRVRRIFDSGRRLTVERLWNGEYFIQQVDLAAHPEHQYGPGCLSDQLFGQGWAHQLALGYIYPPELVRQALASIWKYNWTPDVGPYNARHPPERWFAYPGDAGLFVCTWPHGVRPARGVRYRNEVWTGIEYQVAGHMLWEGMVDEALAIVRGVHERYDPLRHNPFNEVECGDHYARALASWGVYTALCGYEYHGPKGHLGFAPRLSPENFRAAFTAAEGWGSFSQERHGAGQTARVELRWGRLRLASLALAVPPEVDRGTVRARLGKRTLGLYVQSDGPRLVVHLDEEVTLNAGEVFEVQIGAPATGAVPLHPVGRAGCARPWHPAPDAQVRRQTSLPAAIADRPRSVDDTRQCGPRGGR